ILRKCDAVISGSTALHILLPECGTSWTPRDLDIYVLQANSAMLLHHILLQGYRTIKDVDLNKKGYTYSMHSHVVVVTDGHRRIDIIVSSSSAAMTPIFQFHSTAVMNFISVDTIFSCYPALTLRHPSMMNAGHLYYGTPTGTLLEAVRKYQARGF
ncbi:hypothetical protein BKA83DRAFT_4014945, partial [Pisolithus microcarpus]